MQFHIPFCAACLVSSSAISAQTPQGGRGGPAAQGRQLDLEGKGAQARELFQKAIDTDEELGVITGSAMLKDETKCIRCGLCAARCAVNVITMEAYHWWSKARRGSFRRNRCI